MRAISGAIMRGDNIKTGGQLRKAFRDWFREAFWGTLQEIFREPSREVRWLGETFFI